MKKSFFIARRFLQALTQEQNIATMLKVCGISIIVSSFALTLIIAIIQGFQNATVQALQNIHFDITLQAPAGKTLQYEKINRVINEEFSDLIAHTAPVAYHHAIIQNRTKQSAHDFTHVVVIQGIDPEHDIRTRTLLKKIGVTSLPEMSLCIGSPLAQQLSFQQNGTATLLFNTELSKNDREETLHFEKAELPVKKVFSTGIDDFDGAITLCTLSTFQELFPDRGIAHIGIHLKPHVAPDIIIKKLKERFHCDCISWQESYAPLLDALQLERMAMFLIILLVAGIASITTMALLMMYMFYQKTTFAIFMAMGMSTLQLRSIITLIGSCITLFSTIVGVLGATCVSFLLEHYQLITLPNAYYINYVPAQLTLYECMLVIALMNAVSLLTSWLTSSLIQKMNLIMTLKHGGR